MKKQRIYKVQTQYIFEGVFEVVAKNKEEAQEKVLYHCGLVMGGDIHSTLPEEEITWDFSTHPQEKIRKVILLKG